MQTLSMDLIDLIFDLFDNLMFSMFKSNCVALLKPSIDRFSLPCLCF
jgi:hypothetical protein